MNGILAHDTACAKRGLTLRTYQVVPMTTRVGMIEWVSGTKPIQMLIQEQLARIEGSHREVHILHIPAAKVRFSPSLLPT
jgi:DNA-dependent protein kinase catalytic subunit